MSYTVHELKSTKELKAFADFPNKLYKDNPYYVPGLLSDDLNMFNWEKNPSFDYLRDFFTFLCFDEKSDKRLCKQKDSSRCLFVIAAYPA